MNVLCATGTDRPLPICYGYIVISSSAFRQHVLYLNLTSLNSCSLIDSIKPTCYCASPFTSGIQIIVNMLKETWGQSWMCLAVLLCVQNCDAFATFELSTTSSRFTTTWCTKRQTRQFRTRVHSASNVLHFRTRVHPASDVLPITNQLPNQKEDKKSVGASSAAHWHQKRRQEMLAKYSSKILPLEQQSHGLFVGLPILLFSNLSLAFLAIRSASMTVPQIAAMAFPASIFSLWQLQILHDALHSSLMPKPTLNNPSKSMRKIVKHRKKIQKFILFFGSMPSAFGYYLYLQYGHLTHHKSLGDPDKVSLATLFNSTQKNFEDGDVLFTAHRMKLLGEIGPTFKLTWPKERKITMSISKSGFSLWKEGHPIRNALAFTSSFMFERIMLIMNDFVVALAGKNFFFPNKPIEFHKECANYCRWAVFVRLALCFVAKSWKPLIFLYFAETLWSIPPHPACAMFITNHGSKEDSENGGCIPSSSTYAGKWYSLMTLGTNYHVEHHDFPTIPLHKLGKLREIAPEFYRGNERDHLFGTMKKAFGKPEFYACMNANIISES